MVFTESNIRSSASSQQRSWGLQSQLRGRLILPESADYESARRIWNGMIDCRPAMIARVAGAADVQKAVRFARAEGLPLSVRGGGHHIAGTALCEGGLVIDLSDLRSVVVDPQKSRAQVAPGATLADFDAEAQSFGLATPLGINSTTGVAGLTLGGGFGWLSRKYGMTVDNLLAADVVTADAELVHANADENPDLFWALRGGGGNFGVVTRFVYQLHPVGPDVLCGLIVYPMEASKEVLYGYRALLASMPDELSCWLVVRDAPPLPFLPAETHGKPVVIVALMYAGDPATGQNLCTPLRQLAKPIGEHLGMQPYRLWQQAFDPLLTPGARNYWKSHNLTMLSDAAIDVALEYALQLPSPQCEIFFGLLGGEASRIAADATAYPHRDTLFALNVHARWSDPSQDGRCIAWARSMFAAMAPHASGGVYVNFLTIDEPERIASAYGGNYRRLAAIKQKFDPENLFRSNQNIQAVSQVS